MATRRRSAGEGGSLFRRCEYGLGSAVESCEGLPRRTAYYELLVRLLSGWLDRSSDYGINCKRLPTTDLLYWLNVPVTTPPEISGTVLISAGDLEGIEFGDGKLNPYDQFRRVKPTAVISIACTCSTARSRFRWRRRWWRLVMRRSWPMRARPMPRCAGLGCGTVGAVVGPGAGHAGRYVDRGWEESREVGAL